MHHNYLRLEFVYSLSIASVWTAAAARFTLGDLQFGNGPNAEVVLHVQDSTVLREQDLHSSVFVLIQVKTTLIWHSQERRLGCSFYRGAVEVACVLPAHSVSNSGLICMHGIW